MVEVIIPWASCSPHLLSRNFHQLYLDPSHKAAAAIQLPPRTPTNQPALNTTRYSHTPSSLAVTRARDHLGHGFGSSLKSQVITYITCPCVPRVGIRLVVRAKPENSQVRYKTLHQKGLFAGSMSFVVWNTSNHNILG